MDGHHTHSALCLHVCVCAGVCTGTHIPVFLASLEVFPLDELLDALLYHRRGRVEPKDTHTHTPHATTVATEGGRHLSACTALDASMCVLMNRCVYRPRLQVFGDFDDQLVVL